MAADADPSLVSRRFWDAEASGIGYLHAMSFRTWFDSSREIVLRRLNTGEVRSTLRNYLISAFAAGLLIGGALTVLWMGFGAIFILLIGGGLGYAARSYISFRRREAARQSRSPW